MNLCRKQPAATTVAITACLMAVTVGYAQPPAQTAAPRTAKKAATVSSSQTQQLALFARWDTNHDNSLSSAEFEAGWQQLQAKLAIRQLHTQFEAMDLNRNNCLEPAEYTHLKLIRRAGKTAPAMAKFDTDKNQCLNFKEYVNLVQVLIKPSAPVN